MIVGAVSFMRLPVAPYPEIAPPVINVTGQYPGASADVVATTVVSPIEDQINGWQERKLVEELERHIGRDLQYIRINGTLVGGLAGLAIALATSWGRA